MSKQPAAMHPIAPLRRFSAPAVFATVSCVIVFAFAPPSVSTPRTPPAAFHAPLVRPRGSKQFDGRVCMASDTCLMGSADSSVSSEDNASIVDKIARALGLDQSFKQRPPLASTSKSAEPKRTKGRVVRTAARPQQPSGGSIPSSRHYTTRKPSLPMIAVSNEGVTGDYNHYRTVALKSTANRAISILTRDVSSYIQTLDGGYFAKSNGYTDGDLGENVLVEGVDFGFFKVGQRYRFSSSVEGKAPGSEDVVVEITEPMEPCANLCKLPYINDPTISSPKERVARCQRLIEALGRREGLRGWYAKVVAGGVIRIGDTLSAAALA